MIVPWRKWGANVSVLAVLLLFTACTGITPKQLSVDPVCIETERIHKSVSLKRLEFFQQKQEYALAKRPAHLDRMSELMQQVRGDLERAEYFQQHAKYYRKGIDYERWKSAGTTYRLCRITLCEMLLETGELEMKSADKEYAAALFNAVIAEFDGEDFAGYVDQARNFLEKIEKDRLYAASKTPAAQDVH